MIPPELLPDGRIRLVRRAEGDDGAIGDALVEIDESDPEYDEALVEIRRREGAT